MKPKKSKKKASKKTSTSKGRKTITLTMDRPLKELLDMIANGAGTNLETVCNVLLVLAMHFGRKVGAPETHKMLTDAAARIMELEAKLCRCRQVMEANDPGNARDIFGEPEPAPSPAAQPEGAATVP